STYNIAASPRYVIAPVTFVPPYAWSGNTSFWVDGTAASGTSMVLTVYAYDEMGHYVTSGNVTVSVSGWFSRHVDLNGISNTDYISFFTQLPANSSTQIFGVLSST
ncbi:MAG TPA: hypothetical protein VNG33_05025, partial [Polyangiaceae bacterium]|nr:hypothetical protein [Polyangiaceae bacterium]